MDVCHTSHTHSDNKISGQIEEKDLAHNINAMNFGMCLSKFTRAYSVQPYQKICSYFTG